MILSEIRQSNLPEADKKMFFYDRMLSLMCLKRHNMDRYSEVLPYYLYWKLRATGSVGRLQRETVLYIDRLVTDRYMRFRVTDWKALPQGAIEWRRYES